MATESTIVNDRAEANSANPRAGYSANSTALPPRIALLTPYSGGNLGDAAIQDAMIANLRHRFPDAAFSGISLNSTNFLKQHGQNAFPLCATRRPFYGMSQEGSSDQNDGQSAAQTNFSAVKSVLKKIPGVKLAAIIRREVAHCLQGYRFLRHHDLLVISGGGQLDEEWGGPWGHPYALFKWATLTKLAGVPCAVTSVGACKTESSSARFFLARLLRKSRYRSYRDQNSKKVASNLLPIASRDAVMPDIAFTMPAAQIPKPADIRTLTQGRKIVAISLISYAKPQNWPHEDGNLYERYLRQMAQVVGQLLAQDRFIAFVWSARADINIVQELLDRLDQESKNKISSQVWVPAISSWKDLMALLLDADYLIVSRLHSVILGFVAKKPTVAISFDPKVDWVMQDVGMTDYLLQISNFEAKDVIAALQKLGSQQNEITNKISSYVSNAISVSAEQYDALAELIRNHQANH